MATDINREEFETWMGVLREDIKGVHSRLDSLNGRTRKAEETIAVLKDRAGSGTAAAWGGGIGGAVVAIIEAVKWTLAK